jgi:hypothetical protein
MRLRRPVLLLGITLFVLAALQPTWGVCAGGPLDAEATAFGGSVPSHMTCGPDVRVKYGGAGGRLETHFDDGPLARPGTGLSVGGGGAVAYDHLLLYRPCGPPSDCATSSYAEGVGAGSVGYDWRSFGFRAGLLLWGRDNGLLPFPDGALRFGDVDGIRVVVGLGAYDVPTMLRPGLYAGILAPLERGWQLDMHVGQHLGMSGLSSMRVHGGLRVPIASSSWLTLGAALWANEVGTGPEGDVGWGARF